MALRQIVCFGQPLAGFGVVAVVVAARATVGCGTVAAVTLGLLAVGAALRVGRSEEGGRLGAAYLCAVKLLALPALAWGLASLFGLTGVAFATAVIFAALPTASSAYILAMRMGGDGPGVAWLISATTVAAAVTLTAWLTLLGSTA